MTPEGLLLIYKYRPQDDIFEKLWGCLSPEEKNLVWGLVTGFQEEDAK